jgi:hypothetical protein
MPEEVRRLIEAAAEDRLSVEQFDELERRLAADAAVARWYIDYMQLHADLHLMAHQRHSLSQCKELLGTLPGAPGVASQPADNSVSPVQIQVARDSRRPGGFLDRPPASFRWRRHPVRFAVLATALMLLVCCGLYYFIRPAWMMKPEIAVQPGQTAGPLVARLRQAVNTHWGGDRADAPEPGASLHQGRTLKLTAGLAEIGFDSGARVIIEGPCEFTVGGKNAGHLRVGKLCGHVPKEANGFLIETPFATVTDRGTEFGLEVGDETVRVAVYEGALEVAASLPTGTRRGERITAGGVAIADGSGALKVSATGAEALKFVRDIRDVDLPIHRIAVTGPEGGLVGEVPFQSHNQKVVANDNGIFVTHAEGILQRSTDGGRTFSTVFNANIKGLDPPTLETDEDGNLYLIYPEKRQTRFQKFTAVDGYTAPIISKAYAEASSGSCFVSVYDRVRGRFYHATQWGHLLTIDKAGRLLRSQRVFTAGSTGSVPFYPYLFVDESGVIHCATTTVDRADSIPYESIRYLMSTDGGQTWCRMGGQPVATPTTCDPDGPSTMINLPEEVQYNTWLANMHAKNGKVHFMYLARNPAGAGRPGRAPKIEVRQHYMRFDSRTGKREIDSWSDWNNAWRGNELRIHSVCGFFVSDPADPGGPLFAVGALDAPGRRDDPRKLAALVSYDNGTTWRDYAVSDDIGKVWAEGGYRCVTQQGRVIGTFASAKPQWATTLFFQFDAKPTSDLRPVSSSVSGNR